MFTCDSQNPEQYNVQQTLVEGQWWYHTFIISALGRLRLEDRCQFKASLGFM